MRKLSIFEVSILGFFAGIIVATYLSFVISFEGHVGKILNLVSLRPLLNFGLEKLPYPISSTLSLVITFLFFVAVFTAYSALVGVALKYSQRTKLVIIFLVVIVLSITAEQTYGHLHAQGLTTDMILATASEPTRLMTKEKKHEKFFGMEAWGDLNGDNTDDVFFIIHRDDADRGTLYYGTAALTTGSGKEGTNLFFFGDKTVPDSISISDGLIIINTHGSPDGTTKVAAKIIDGELVKTEVPTDSQLAPSI